MQMPMIQGKSIQSGILTCFANLGEIWCLCGIHSGKYLKTILVQSLFESIEPFLAGPAPVSGRVSGAGSTPSKAIIGKEICRWSSRQFLVLIDFVSKGALQQVDAHSRCGGEEQAHGVRYCSIRERLSVMPHRKVIKHPRAAE